ncbi:MAG: hypothetical protein PXY39_04640 [archaeon]|nr:hypothetical protein [archaeon]
MVETIPQVESDKSDNLPKMQSGFLRERNGKYFICLTCKRSFYRSPCRLVRANRFCSLQCYWNNKEAQLERTKRNYPGLLRWQQQNPELFEASRKTMLGKHHSEERKQKIAAGGIITRSLHPEIVKGMARKLKSYNEDPTVRKRKSNFRKAYLLLHPEQMVLAHVHKKGGYPRTSNEQKLVFEKARQLYPDSVMNMPIKMNGGKIFFADVAIPSEKWIIEYDGVYWHKERNSARDLALANEGWHVDHIVGR